MYSRGVIERYKKYLPVNDKTPVITLGEGETPLVFSAKLSDITGVKVFLKFEGGNPTGSFKDRGMTVAVSKALEKKAKAILCASTGNTSASAAAYGARAGLPCFVLLPEGAVALGKLSQAIIANAKIISIDGNFDDALDIARKISGESDVTLVNSVNPDRIEGQKTGAFEICDQLDGSCPDFHLIPVGNAGNITAYWKGYNEYKSMGKINSLPYMLGFQAEGAAPIVINKVVKEPKTFATAIRIGNPASWKAANAAIQESNGSISSVTDDEIRDAYKWLAANEGLFVEPASAASVAGLIKLNKQGFFKKHKESNSKLKAVCILTGTGLKDPDSAVYGIDKPASVKADVDSVLKAMKL